MKTVLNTSLVKKEMPSILKSLSKYAYTNKAQENCEEMIKGEAFTLIRRRLPYLVGSSINLTKHNIERVYLNYNTGEIQWFNFIAQYGGCYDKEIIDELNDIVREVKPDYKTLALSMALNSISERINNYKIVK